MELLHISSPFLEFGNPFTWSSMNVFFPHYACQISFPKKTTAATTCTSWWLWGTRSWGDFGLTASPREIRVSRALKRLSSWRTGVVVSFQTQKHSSSHCQLPSQTSCSTTSYANNEVAFPGARKLNCTNTSAMSTVQLGGWNVWTKPSLVTGRDHLTRGYCHELCLLTCWLLIIFPCS
jgi:hypothetical protein